MLGAVQMSTPGSPRPGIVIVTAVPTATSFALATAVPLLVGTVVVVDPDPDPVADACAPRPMAPTTAATASVDRAASDAAIEPVTRVRRSTLSMPPRAGSVPRGP